MTESTTKSEKPKKKRKYYRSPLDKLVSNSGFTAKAIAQKMGIKYDRMVALRRIKEISKTDLNLCRRAIEELVAGNTLPLQEVVSNPSQNSFNGDSPERVAEEFDADMQKEQAMFCKIVDRLAAERFKRQMDLPERMAATSFLLGKCWSMLNGLLVNAAENRFAISQGLLEEMNRITSDIERLLYSN